MGRLHGKIAFITGTADGQGRAAALLFAREGALVVGCDLKAEANEQTAQLVRAGIPLGRWGRPDDIAYAALYLASDEASWVTAANFVIDGGITGIRS
jgi:NAD(P)-dependent dehydrogenase (short-subunit alcohol dehydrogenase family)